MSNKSFVPQWINWCNHDFGSYVGSFENGKVFYDVYVYWKEGTQSVCVRYGNSREEYISIGSLRDLYAGNGISGNYKAITNFLNSQGSIVYIRKED